MNTSIARTVHLIFSGNVYSPKKIHMSPDEKLVNVRVVSSGEGKARFQIKHNISPQIVYVLMNETIH